MARESVLQGLCVDRGRGGSNVTMGMRVTTRSWKRQGADSALEPPGGMQQGPHLLLALKDPYGLLTSRM